MLNRSSRTAEQVALFRALESARRTGRIFDDPFAAGFLPGAYRLVARAARVPGVGRRVERFIDGRWPAGPRGSAVVRTRLIDDLVTESLAARQVVLLGAGYDSRAYRLPGMAERKVFEVDHPATQARKMRLLGARRRTHVGFVGVDLVTGDLAAALREAGFVPREPTVVVWEGVTNYLTAEAVDATIRGIVELAAAGSVLIFTYVDRRVLAGDDSEAGAQEWRAAVGRGGEPWTFGFDPGELRGYLDARGMELTDDLSAQDAADRYLAPLGRDEPTAAFYRIARATVKENSAEDQ